MLQLTLLERAVLAAIAEQAAARYPGLRSLLKAAGAKARENTGHGFYTTLGMATADVPTIPERRFDGPIACMADMGPGMTMGFILWCEAGYPDCLEGYQNCDDEGRTIDLRDRDLADLTFTKLEWI